MKGLKYFSLVEKLRYSAMSYPLQRIFSIAKEYDRLLLNSIDEVDLMMAEAMERMNFWADKHDLKLVLDKTANTHCAASRVLRTGNIAMLSVYTVRHKNPFDLTIPRIQLLAKPVQVSEVTLRPLIKNSQTKS